VVENIKQKKENIKNVKLGQRKEDLLRKNVEKAKRKKQEKDVNKSYK